MQPSKDFYDVEASCTKTVASINGKISTAVDLLRCLLKFMVREEIEVLQRKIHKLSKKEALLLQENMSLRDNANPEVLELLEGDSCELSFDSVRLALLPSVPSGGGSLVLPQTRKSCI